MFFFFFQAEDGIRDVAVTGVQTCALPIWFRDPRRAATAGSLPPCVWPTSVPARRAALREPLRSPYGLPGGPRSWFSLFAHRHLHVISHPFSPQFGVQQNPRAREPQHGLLVGRVLSAFLDPLSPVTCCFKKHALKLCRWARAGDSPGDHLRGGCRQAREREKIKTGRILVLIFVLVVEPRRGSQNP